MRTPGTISHQRNDETLSAKTRWFTSLSMQQRMELLDEFTELALAANPNVFKDKVKHAQISHPGIQVLTCS